MPLLRSRLLIDLLFHYSAVLPHKICMHTIQLSSGSSISNQFNVHNDTIKRSASAAWRLWRVARGLNSRIAQIDSELSSLQLEKGNLQQHIKILQHQLPVDNIKEQRVVVHLLLRLPSPLLTRVVPCLVGPCPQILLCWLQQYQRQPLHFPFPQSTWQRPAHPMILHPWCMLLLRIMGAKSKRVLIVVKLTEKKENALMVTVHTAATGTEVFVAGSYQAPTSVHVGANDVTCTDVSTSQSYRFHCVGAQKGRCTNPYVINHAFQSCVR